MASTKLPPSGHVIYDSGTDTSTGKKRAVIPGGGVSVAERARLFGTQITSSLASKNYNSTNHQTQRPPINNQSTKSNVIHQERNYQKPRIDNDQRSKQNTAYSSTPRVPNNYRSATETNDRPKREQVSSTNQRDYSKTIRPNYNNSHSPSHQRPHASYDSFKRVSPQRQVPTKAKQTQIRSSDSYSSDDGTYTSAYDRHKTPPYSQKSSRNPTYRSSNYFRPIHDPLDVLFKDAPQEYIQQQMPTTIETNMNGMQAFDLGSLINRIQQDYAANARPYVSSVQFVEQGQSLADIGFLTPAINRKDYIRRTDDIYNRQVPSKHYEIIQPNGFYPYEQMNSRRLNTDSYYSSMKRRRHHRRYHNQATSPIHILESSGKDNTRFKPESGPATPVPKVPTPVVASSSSEEEEEVKTTIAQPAESESSSEEESEEESTVAAPPPPPSSQPASAPTTQPNGIARPTLPNQTPLSTARVPPKAKSESEESDSEESDSDSDSESDDEDEKPKPKPLPSARPNMQRTTPSTPQTNSRGPPQRGNFDTNSLNQPPESSQSVNSFDLQDSGKPSSFGGRLKSITNIFRRNKS